MFTPAVLFFRVRGSANGKVVGIALTCLVKRCLGACNLPRGVGQRDQRVLSNDLTNVFVLGALLATVDKGVVLEFTQSGGLLVVVTSVVVFCRFAQ